jgi:hypothetical protein
MVNWHWDKPFWPISDVIDKDIASKLIIYRCVLCGKEYRGDPTKIALHHYSQHGNETPKIIIYPVLLGCNPIGGDGDSAGNYRFTGWTRK